MSSDVKKAAPRYTGLRDKNGIKIMEGAWVNDGKGMGVVGFQPPSFVVQDKDGVLWSLGGGKVYPLDHQLKDTRIVPRHQRFCTGPQAKPWMRSRRHG